MALGHTAGQDRALSYMPPSPASLSSNSSPTPPSTSTSYQAVGIIYSSTDSFVPSFTERLLK